MRRRVAHIIILVLACAAWPAGCGGARTGGAGGADELAAALGELTKEVTARVEANADTKAGVADARRLLDSRKAAMAEQIAAFNRGAGARDPGEKAKWLEAEVENTERLRGLQLKYLDASLRDPELKAGLERLAADYDSMFRDR